ncbi:MAG: hypothetical protein HQK83_13900 [Fibrobacteria bacterium]|nr:hypothetical protein [Fibrobacteria bacterium]
MNSISSITLSSVLYASILFFASCGGEKPDVNEGENNASTIVNNPEKIVVPLNNQPLTEMKITYGNKSAKVNLLVDINSQDININMTGRPGETKSKFPWLEKEEEPSSVSPTKKEKGNSQTPGASAEKNDKEDEWGDVMNIPKNSNLNKKEMQAVLAEIRKAQEFFYQKKYPEALDMTKYSLEKQETSEGYALMGSILYMMGDKMAAKESWLRSLKINPDMPAVSQMLENLKRESR